MVNNTFNNHNSNVGMQGGTNDGVVQSGDGNVSIFKNSKELDQQIDELLIYVRNEQNDKLEVIEGMVADLKVANEDNDTSGFKKILGYINGVLGPVAQVAAIASSVGLTF
ncbi:hypothetical protein [Enterococcus xiangfangensis]|uniref:hypothetical protein n=1 Tax=Enterococcus xiangfangensis TaxID=1296537 RepID=UPI003D177558|nr:hypothetical protein [Enterococcus asini]